MQIQQAKRQKEPAFEVITSLTDSAQNIPKSKQREFFIECCIETLDEQTRTVHTLKSEGNWSLTTTKSGVNLNESQLLYTGRGTTKKLAKQKAAEEMLVKLGYQVTAPSILKAARPAEAKPLKADNNERKVKFSDVVTTSPETAATSTLSSSATLNGQINSEYFIHVLLV